MEPPGAHHDSLTPAQLQAVAARGNVLVMAGAGTGKTKTLIARCLDCLDRERASLPDLLVVTFTEAAAAELRQRLRRELEQRAAAAPADPHWQQQLALFDLAHIGTLHGFCLRLVRAHFHELGLDPRLAILDDGEARQLAHETLEAQLSAHYAGTDEFSAAVRSLIQIQGGGRDESIRALILRLHHYSQTRPDAARWLAAQSQTFSVAEPAEWQGWLLAAIADWRDAWLPRLESLGAGHEKAAELNGVLSRLNPDFRRAAAADVLARVVAADGDWPARRKTILREPLVELFAEAGFLGSLATVDQNADPLAEDWSWIRPHMATLLRLAREFAGSFSEQKLAGGVLDFHDLEQFALKLLWDFSRDQPTAVAETWRRKLRFIFVDEYQDINAAQDRIIAALARGGAEGNRFLVGDVKQSIYRFRLADPGIFRNYARAWHGDHGQVIALADNFRSRQGLLEFVNSVFGLVLREEVGGVAYPAGARLKFGAPGKRAELGTARRPEPRVDLLLRCKTRPGEIADGEGGKWADLEEAAKEARLMAHRLQQLVADRHEIWDEDHFRPVQFGDMAVLLRSPRGKAEVYAREFEAAGVPLAAVRGGFYDGREILDCLSLLQLLDNPLQDVPCIAVLRSPLVGLSLDELAEIRLAAEGEHFWTALVRSTGAGRRPTESTTRFLERFARWRKLARQLSLSGCLEAVLAETGYAEWLRAQPRGAQRSANLARFLHLAQGFDQFQRQGLFRFLKFIEAQRNLDAEPDVAAVPTTDAVQLLSIHQSKGLEFPVVALPDLAKPFNEQDRHEEILFDEEFGLCPKVKAPTTGRRYPSLPYWLAQRRQHRELRGEELRLFYVALTRARDTLILSATITDRKWATLWAGTEPVTLQRIASAGSFADWLGLWFGAQGPKSGGLEETSGERSHLRWRRVDDAALADAVSASSGQRPRAVEPPSLAGAEAEKLREVLNWEYPHGAATRRKAKASVTELRRAAEDADETAEPLFPPFPPPALAARLRKPANGKRKLNAAESGTAHHTFLQHVALDRTGELAAEADRLVRENLLPAADRASLDLAALAAFWDSKLGRDICRHAAGVRRELPFTARFRAAELAGITGGEVESGLAEEYILVQGVADLVVLRPEEIWVVDFKTDAVRRTELPDKLRIYQPQLLLYARALEKIYARPVRQCWLHFLALRHSEPVV